jgi:putative acetyltransferase
MLPSLEIRDEAVSDAVPVHAVVRDAFGRDAEARLVDALRERADPRVSLVAVSEGAVVGHIFASPVSVGGAPGVGMAIGPVAVTPSLQRRAVGGALVRAALERSRSLGRELVFLLGHPEYYPRFGFERAGSHGFTYHGQDYGPAFMVCELVDGAAARHAGDVAFHPAFAQVEG